MDEIDRQDLLLPPKTRREIYWMIRPKRYFLFTGVLPCALWCLLAFMLIGHFADVRGLHTAAARATLYHTLDPLFFPGLAWLVFRWVKIF
jgi:hypothetical protein